MLRYNLILVFSCSLGCLFSQPDSIPYKIFEEQYIPHSSIGYNTAPFVIDDEFSNSTSRIRYRANMNPVLGFGFSYKWLSLGFSFKLPGYIKDTERFGESNYLDLDAQYQWEKWFFTGDFHYYKGFSAINANTFTPDTLGGDNPNIIKEELRTYSLSLNAYQFLKDDFQMKASQGIVGRYKEKTWSLYSKYTLNFHGINNNKNSILPESLTLSSSKSLWDAHAISAFDFGAVPGIAYVNNIDGWQFGLQTGLGLVIQTKFYSFDEISRGFLGLAPRLDLNFQAGYNVDKWFLMLNSSVDNKSIRFNDYRYRQMYYYVRLTGGFRF